MRDAERVEMAHSRFGESAPKFRNPVKTPQTKANEPVPMGIGRLQLVKLTAAEWDLVDTAEYNLSFTLNKRYQSGWSKSVGCRSSVHVADRLTDG